VDYSSGGGRGAHLAPDGNGLVSHREYRDSAPSVLGSYFWRETKSETEWLQSVQLIAEENAVRSSKTRCARV